MPRRVANETLHGLAAPWVLKQGLGLVATEHSSAIEQAPLYLVIDEDGLNVPGLEEGVQEPPRSIEVDRLDASECVGTADAEVLDVHVSSGLVSAVSLLPALNSTAREDNRRRACRVDGFECIRRVDETFHRFRRSKHVDRRRL